jgi:hypothetical protein
MLIVIHTKAYYDWEKYPNITEEEKTGSSVKLSHDGTWLRKVQLDKATTVTVNLPESEIVDVQAHFERKGEVWPRTREQVVAWYLATKTLTHCAHPDNFTDISVLGEPEIEKALKEFFKVEE